MSLDDIERCYDAIPRPAGTTEEWGPFTLFLAAEGTGWQYYARPRLGLTEEITPDDVRRVLARQVELGVPRAIEWVDQVTPSLRAAVRAAVPEAEIGEYPLLAMSTSALAEEPAGCVVLTPAHPDLGLVVGAVDAGFGGRDEFESASVGGRPAMIESGALMMVAAYDADGTVVGGGAAAPRENAGELMGIAVAPPAQGRGHGTQITRALVAALRDAGIGTAFLSAGSDGAASIYRAVGFERIGTAMILEIEDD